MLEIYGRIKYENGKPYIDLTRGRIPVLEEDILIVIHNGQVIELSYGDLMEGVFDGHYCTISFDTLIDRFFENGLPTSEITFQFEQYGYDVELKVRKK
jgi:hypothetical protein